MLGTLRRASAVLDLFTTEEPEWGVTATAQRLGIGKSLAHDILSSLAAIGLLQRVGHGRYRLGWRTISLASVLLRTSELKAQARPVVRELAERQRLPVSLVAWGCDRIIYLDCRRDQRYGGDCAPVAGTAAPLDGSAIAKVLLASRSAHEVEVLWSDGLVRSGHTSLRELASDLDRVRLCGWARDDAEARCTAAWSPRPSAIPRALSRPRSALTSPTGYRGSTPTRTRGWWWRPRCGAASLPGRLSPSFWPRTDR
ncbi:MAG: IclR family transcriptional regulator [Solirubrobacteraceae bacterium]